ncbi:hypothetical protein FB451DRAFT_1408621 [Mycena latifolia]|nr:hypothetical protein FB451DRAFT_1408621 [Mycena latifolia]
MTLSRRRSILLAIYWPKKRKVIVERNVRFNPDEVLIDDIQSEGEKVTEVVVPDIAADYIRIPDAPEPPALEPPALKSDSEDELHDKELTRLEKAHAWEVAQLNANGLSSRYVFKTKHDSDAARTPRLFDRAATTAGALASRIEREYNHHQHAVHASHQIRFANGLGDILRKAEGHTESIEELLGIFAVKTSINDPAAPAYEWLDDATARTTISGLLEEYVTRVCNPSNGALDSERRKKSENLIRGWTDVRSRDFGGLGPR